jgi:WhiB family redox-sensing transcriptional regulator
MDWRFRAACREVDPELFFPPGPAGPGQAQLVAAKAVCARCPVLLQCRTWAFVERERTGVWGGLSEDERRVAHRGEGALELFTGSSGELRVSGRHAVGRRACHGRGVAGGAARREA